MPLERFRVRRHRQLARVAAQHWLTYTYVHVVGEGKHNWLGGATKRGCIRRLAGTPSAPRTRLLVLQGLHRLLVHQLSNLLLRKTTQVQARLWQLEQLFGGRTKRCDTCSAFAALKW